MPTLAPAPPALTTLFRRTPVVDLDALRRALRTSSRTTVFRTLRTEGYLTSFSHTGRYYTLRRIPRFDARGLWWADDIGFSTHGTLRRTLVALVEDAPAGQTHDDLRAVVRLRVHDTLRLLMQTGAIVRDPGPPASVYLSATPAVAAAQRLARQQATVSAPVALDIARVIAVLVEVIHHPQDDAVAIVRRLHAAGQRMPIAQVEAVFRQYALKKKTGRSPSRRSRP